MRGVVRRLREYFATPVVWPGLEAEIGDCRQYLRGRVLNAGAGHRDLAPLVDGEVWNQDLPGGLHNADIDIHAPLHRIPKPDGFFDAVFCNAVLEHVANPHEVLAEFHRVLRDGGHLYLCVPFMQPEHLDPTDYQRYTRDGLQQLVADHHFEVERTDPVHNVYHTVAWVVDEWLRAKRTPLYVLLRLAILPILKWRSAHSTTQVESIASAYRVIAKKRAAV